MNACAIVPPNAYEPLLLGPPGHRRFAVWHAANTPARAALVLCPPILHEYTRSYRMWALVAARLATVGVACLRLDYFGCGDSTGDDMEFSLTGAAQDVALGLGELHRRLPGVAQVVLGVRAGCWPAWFAAAASAVDQLWLWQPIADGSAYLEHLHELDAIERGSYERYPWHRGKPVPFETGTLMGMPCGAGLQAEIGFARIPGKRLDGRTRITVLDSTQGARADYAGRQIALPASLCDWAEQMYMGDCRLGREFDAVLQCLLEPQHRKELAGESRIDAWKK
jgi:hypothetical protein